MLKNPKDVQPKEGAGISTCYSSSSTCGGARITSRDGSGTHAITATDPVMLKLSDNLVVPKKQDPGDQRSSEYIVVSLSRKG